ncbi:hypothetical protein ACHAQH_002555 [Verticillium albo-atrum]
MVIQEYRYTAATTENDPARRRRHKGKDKHVSYEDAPEQDLVHEGEAEDPYAPSAEPTIDPSMAFGSLDISNDPELARMLREDPGFQLPYVQGGASSSREAYATLDPQAPGNQPAEFEAMDVVIRGHGRIGDRETLDKRYKVHKSKYFKVGEVFKVLWPEPMGAMAGAPTISDRGVLRDRFGGLVHVGFRRFIVIATDEGHSTCVPILTYGDQGCKKRGVKPHHHGVVYTSSKPKMLDSEPQLGAPPARMEITEQGEKLSKSSRANYSKMMSIEHNVKVFFIGRIKDDYHVVYDAVNACWENKEHHRPAGADQPPM